VAGLAAARAASRAGLRVTLLEAAERLGGKVLTETVDGVPWEMGPDALVATKPRGRDLLEELGLLEEAVAPATGRAYLLDRGELRPIPAGTAMGIPKGPGVLVDAVRAGILSPWGALRAAVEPLTPRVRRGDRELEDTLRKRLGREVANRLARPLVGGVFGGVGGVPGMDATLPDLARGHSLMLAARRRPAARFLGLRGGMGRLVERLAADLGEVDVRTGSRARSIEDLCGAYTVRTDHGPVEAEAVLLAVPGARAGSLLASLSGRGAPVPAFSSSAIVHLRYPGGALGRALDAAGYIRAHGEPGLVTACSWVSVKWPHLDDGRPHLRAIVSADRPAAIPDDVGDRVVEEVGRVMRADRDPVDVRIHRWATALPGYPVGHRARVERLRASLPPGVEVAGASHDGIGIPDCVASGEAAVARLLPRLLG
jgi:oxygen-dependent protoporphyrinogen oxidase